MEGEILDRVMTFFAVSFILSALITQTAGQWITWMIITAIIVGIMVMISGVYITKDPNNKNSSAPYLVQQSLSKKRTVYVKKKDILMARQRSKSSGHRTTLQTGREVKVCLSCKSELAPHQFNCPCGSMSFRYVKR